MAKKLNLKDWSEKSLTTDDWNFSDYTNLPKSAISRVYQWELDRELGSGKGPFGKDAANKKWLANVAKGNYEDLPVATVTNQSGASFKTGKDGGNGKKGTDKSKGKCDGKSPVTPPGARRMVFEPPRTWGLWKLSQVTNLGYYWTLVRVNGLVVNRTYIVPHGWYQFR